MKTFTRGNLPTLKESLKQALNQVLAEHKLDVKIGAFSYNHNTASIKLDFVSAGESGVADANYTLYKSHCCRQGLKVSSYNKTFMSNGQEYRISGIAPKAKKYPILAEQLSTGQMYKFSISAIPSDLHW